jgi:hypothetical protein
MRSMPEQTGARVLFQGRAHSVVIGGDGDDWVSKDRSAGLADSRLIAMTELYRYTGS